MIPLNSTLSPPTLFLSTSLLRLTKPNSLTQGTKKQQLISIRRNRREICRAELPQDAPFAIAIGACMLNSLIFPYTGGTHEEEEEEREGALGPTDSRFAVMGIISLIPYFNWLSWVFAWMDTGKQRYAVYAAVYLAPYFRANLSLSPEESWIPIASIVLCIVHIQLEASIRDSDLNAFTFFNEVAKRLGLVTERQDRRYRDQEMWQKDKRPKNMKLPSSRNDSRDEIGKWRVPKKPSKDLEHLDKDDEGKH